MTTLLRLAALLFFLVALLSGGCSLAFGVLALVDPAGDAIVPFVLVGFAIALPCFFAGRALWRKTPKSAPSPPPDAPR